MSQAPYSQNYPIVRSAVRVAKPPITADNVDSIKARRRQMLAGACGKVFIDVYCDHLA